MQVCPGINNNKPIAIPVGPFVFPASSAPTTCTPSGLVVSPGGVFNAPGTAGRDVLRGPGSSNMDLSIFKNFSFTETLKAQLRVQAYNLTNTPHFANPNSAIDGGNFGAVTGTQPFSYRQVELGFRLTF